MFYENSAWCCVVPNAPNSETTFTHVPVTMDDDNKMDHDANLLHKETSSAESVIICEKNENCDTDHVPESLSNNCRLWYIVVWMMTIGVYLLNGAAFSIMGPGMYTGADTLNEIKHQADMFWRSIVIPLVFVSTIMWDTLSFLTAPRNKENKEKKKSFVPRRVVRKCNESIKRIRPHLPALYFFPAWWLIFGTSINVSRATYQGLAPTHPIELASASIADTHRRVNYLDTLVDLSPGTFSQYQKLQANKWLLETFPKEKEKEEVHCDDDYFDTYEEFPVETGENFFDAEEEIDLEPCLNLCDVLNLDSIYQGRRVVDCTGTNYTCNPTEQDVDGTGTDTTCNSTEQDHTEVNLAPSDRALRVLLDGAVVTPVALTTADLLAHIIFDTGASLAISPFRSDFIADPTLLSKPTQLGGMGKGLQIEGVGTVA
jgi:hypothetical protein